jgi:Derlin-2/3
VFTYASGLELNSPRFTQPGDFFTYVVFVATAVLVSDLPSSHFPQVVSRTSHICPPRLFLAEAVPGNEEDYPCGTCRSIIRKSVKGLYAVQAWWWLD